MFFRNIKESIVPPTHYTWLENTEDITPKSSLVLNLFTDEIIDQLQNFNYQQVELIGQKYNDFKNVDFSDRKWRGKKLTFTVEPYSNPNDYRHGSPIVTLAGKQLAMFSVESPKLPIGTTFKAVISPAKGSALSLKIEPDSIELPGLKDKESNSIDSNLIFEKKSTKINDISQILQSAIAEKYQTTNQPKLKVGNWTAFVNRKTQDCFVRDPHRNVIFHSNLANDEIKQPLSRSHQKEFSAIIEDSELSLLRRQPKSQKMITNLGIRQPREAQV